LDAEITVALPLDQNSESVSVGSIVGFGDRTFEGWIDEVAVFSRAISTEEIKTLFAVGNPTAQPVARSEER
jgi:hypothetical protein